jgi:hypothetical protein
MRLIDEKFVLSSSHFATKKEAERKATGYLNANNLKQGTFLYKVVKVYRPVIKYEEIK